MNITIIILNWNGKADTLICLESLKNCSASILVVDNGSTDDSLVAIRAAFPHVELIETGKNLGYAGGNNVGIGHAFKNGADAVVVLNNDVKVSHNMIEGFIALHKKCPRAILGGNTFSMSNPEDHDAIGGMWNLAEGNFDLVFGSKGDKELDYVTGCCLFLPKEIYEQIGAFESSYFLYWEDADLCMRAKRAGFGVIHCTDAILWHKGSASMTGGGAHHAYFWWRGRLLFLKRNCSQKTRRKLYIRVVFPTIFRMFKHLMLKKCQSIYFKMSGKKLGERRLRLLNKYRASFQGINDYLIGKYGNAPSYIFNTIEY